MVKHPAPHPTLVTRRLRLRQFSNEDVDAMHECFADPEAMRFWNTPVHSKRIETERAVHRFIDCTPSYYRFWAVADAKTNLCLGMVNYHDGHIRSKRVAIGYIVNPSRRREGIGAEAVLAMLQFCFGYLGIHRVQAFIHPDNAASRGPTGGAAASDHFCRRRNEISLLGPFFCNSIHGPRSGELRSDSHNSYYGT
jgi:ribosomal-protein-alanine N-acetyltransferase